MNEPERTLTFERLVWIDDRSLSGCAAVTNTTKKPFPISCPSITPAGYGSAYRVLDIIELECLAFDAKILIRQFQMNREPLRVNRLSWDLAVHERLTCNC